MVAPSSDFESDALESLSKTSRIVPGTPEMTPSSSDTTTCSSSFALVFPKFST